jgi:hypothetical protein
MEKVVLTTEEINSLKTIQTEKSKLTEYFGILETEYQLQKTQLINSLLDLSQRETTLGEELQKKYGDGVINVETGEFSTSS